MCSKGLTLTKERYGLCLWSWELTLSPNRRGFFTWGGLGLWQMVYPN